MLTTLYLIFLVGSFSIGYSLIRIGFPEVQEKSIMEKIGMGYLIGLIVFLPSILSIFFTFEKFFFLFALGSYGFIAMIMFIVRSYNKKEDLVELNKKEFFNKIPKKALTKEEQEKLDNNKLQTTPSQNYDSPIEVINTDFKQLKAKELNVENKMNNINHSVTGENENGLFIKDSTKSKTAQRQIFKDSEPNVIDKFRKKTIGLNQDQKKEEIEKLKKLVKNIDLKKIDENKKKQDNKNESNKNNLSIELEELNEIDDEF